MERCRDGALDLGRVAHVDREKAGEVDRGQFVPGRQRDDQLAGSRRLWRDPKGSSKTKADIGVTAARERYAL
jgi:hypothetical protein